MSTNDITNPLNFKLKDTKVLPIDNSPLLRIALAFNSGQYYAAAVDPGTSTNYVLYVDILQQGGGRFKETYKDIENEEEHKAVGVFFNKCGVFEAYYKGMNWDWKTVPKPAKNPGTKTDEQGRPNKYDPMGNTMIPPWFRGKYMPEDYRKTNGPKG